MGPKITSFETKSRGISRTATVDKADQEGAGKDDDVDDLDPFSDSDD